MLRALLGIMTFALALALLACSDDAQPQPDLGADGPVTDTRPHTRPAEDLGVDIGVDAPAPDSTAADSAVDASD